MHFTVELILLILVKIRLISRIILCFLRVTLVILDICAALVVGIVLYLRTKNDAGVFVYLSIFGALWLIGVAGGTFILNGICINRLVL